MQPRHDPFPEMQGVKTYPLAERPSLVEAADFCEVPEPLAGFDSFVDSLPDIYAGTHFKQLVDKIVSARLAGRPWRMIPPVRDTRVDILENTFPGVVRGTPA